MLPLSQRIAFAIFTVLTLTLGCRGFYRLYLRVAQGRADTDPRTDAPAKRLWYAIRTTLTQERVFRKRLALSVFHSFIFYAFVLYLMVNVVDAVEGFLPVRVNSIRFAGAVYGTLTDGFSVLAIVGVLALVLRRFALPSRRSLSFHARTLLHPGVRGGYIQRDSLIVSAFIVFHVGSRVVGNAARLSLEGSDRAQPLSSLLAHAFTVSDAQRWRILGYWGGLGSALLFLAYFPYSKHVHLLMAPLKYFFRREASSGELPRMEIDLEQTTPDLGAARLADLAWPRLLDAYACIQCNRCQDVCPASATGKALSPAALEINKRMVLNDVAREINPLSLTGRAAFETGASAGEQLLQAVISPESVWACTTCGACMHVCPTEDEQMLDIIDIRRNLVMQQGEFPKQLQSAFRGMERAKNPWGIAPEKRMAWAEGLAVPAVQEIPNPDVLYWVGCAASYDPGAQKTARAVVQLLTEAKVKFAVLGKRECCTGDTARRAGNELLYQQLAGENIATLNEVRPRLVIASCPHCVNVLGTEYPQLGGTYTVMHHTEYLASLVEGGRLAPARSEATVTFHDPCYLGRHRGSYEQPRSLLNVLSNDYVEMGRTRSNAFCCGAGGAQFWKEEEPGQERISENRFREVQRTLESAPGEKVLAVGCPFCKSMLQSSPSAGGDESIVIKDVAELLWDGVQRSRGSSVDPTELRLHSDVVSAAQQEQVDSVRDSAAVAIECAEIPLAGERPAALIVKSVQDVPADAGAVATKTERKKWVPKVSASSATDASDRAATLSGDTLEVLPLPVFGGQSQAAQEAAPEEKQPPAARKKWKPSGGS